MTSLNASNLLYVFLDCFAQHLQSHQSVRRRTLTLSTRHAMADLEGVHFSVTACPLKRSPFEWLRPYIKAKGPFYAWLTFLMKINENMGIPATCCLIHPLPPNKKKQLQVWTNERINARGLGPGTHQEAALLLFWHMIIQTHGSQKT